VYASITEARALVTAGNWKLFGALAYYAFDNAVLWATFHAYGHAPQIGVVVMGYVVGSLAAALPIPAGLGVLEGGLIGALVLYGAPAAPAAAAVLLYRGISLSVPIALGALGCARRPRSRSPRLNPRGAPRSAVPELAAAPLDRSECWAVDGNSAVPQAS
jgi:Lysylphosphatidylglycerol synthase TM region